MNPDTGKALKAIARLAIGALLAAGAMHTCGWIYRELVPYKVASSPQDEEAFIRFLQTHFPSSGTYTLPGPDDNDEASKELVETGPVVTLHILGKKDIALKKKTAWARLGQIFLATFLIGVVLRKARPELDTYVSRVVFIALIGLATAVYSDLADPIWLYHPWRWSVAKGILHLASWTVAGLILATGWFSALETGPPENQAKARS